MTLQIRQHLLPRRLRVIVLGSATALAAGTDTAAAGSGSRAGSSGAKASSSTAAGGGGAAETVCPPAHELAWSYDVVITTFNRLSSDWSLRSDPRLAERMVLLKVIDLCSPGAVALPPSSLNFAANHMCSPPWSPNTSGNIINMSRLHFVTSCGVITGSLASGTD